MALDSQILPIPLGGGVDTKTDPKQVAIGKQTALTNARFSVSKEIGKRYGNVPYTKNVQGSSSISAGIALSSYNNQLLEFDNSIVYSYSPALGKWASVANFEATSLSTTSVVRNTTQQVLQDSAVNGNYEIFTYIDSASGASFTIVDSATGRTITSGVVSANGAQAKPLALGVYFVIVYYDSTLTQLRYLAIDTTSFVVPATVLIASDISSAAGTSNFDATIINSKLYVAYNRSTLTLISLYSLTSALVLSSQFTATFANSCGNLTVFGDASNNVWVVTLSNGLYKYFIASSSLGGFVLAITSTGLSGTATTRLTGVVLGTTATVLVEEPTSATYSVYGFQPTLTGTVGTKDLIYSYVSLASKVFSYNSYDYVWLNFTSPYGQQPSYFLWSAKTAQIVARLSPGTAGLQRGMVLPTSSIVSSAASTTLPEVSATSSNSFLFASLIVDEITALNGVVTTQSGVTAATITFPSTPPQKTTLGNNLHLSGGQLMMYDGQNFVEHGFEYYPQTDFNDPTKGTDGAIGPVSSTATVQQKQYVAVYEWTDNQGQVHSSAPSIPVTVKFPPGAVTYLSGTFTNGSAVISSIASTAGVSIGQFVTGFGSGNNIASGFISALTATSITQNTVFSGVTGTFSFAVTSGTTLKFPSLGATTINVATLTLSSVTNLKVGMTIKEATSTAVVFPAGTYIKEINTSTHVLTTSAPALETSTNIEYFTQDINSVTISVCPLTLTKKRNVTVALYATVTNGTIFYRVTSVLAPTYNTPTATTDITIKDTTSDNILVGNDQLYTTGGVVENIEVPATNVLSTYKSRLIAVPAENPLSFWYSKQVIPGTPVQWSDVFVQNVDSRGGNITALFEMDDKLIIFKQNYIFFMFGTGPSPSGEQNDFSEPQLISSDVGCINPNSIVLFNGGIIFQSNKGLYLLDRSLQTSYLGAEVEAYNSYSVTSAQRIPSTTTIYFTLSNGSRLIYDFFYNQWEVDALPVTPVDSVVFNNKYHYVDAAGLVEQETAGTYTDNSVFIPLSVTTGWMNFAGIQGFQRVKELLIVGDYKSPHNLVVSIYTDFVDSSPTQTLTIPVLTDPGVYQFRVFIIRQKCESIKIKITDSNSGVAGQSYGLSALTLEIGVKRGLDKLAASQSFG